jgi:hypothetical protein
VLASALSAYARYIAEQCFHRRFLLTKVTGCIWNGGACDTLRSCVCSWNRWPILGWGYVHRINVRTEDTRLTSRAFMLSSRWPPKPGSTEDVQPTSIQVSHAHDIWGIAIACGELGRKRERIEGERQDGARAEMEGMVGGRTACEEAVFGEDGDCVYENYGDCGG